MELSEKTKKRLIVTVLCILCFVLIIAISSRMKREEPEVAMNPITPAVTEEITPEITEPALTTTPTPTLTSTPEVSVQPIEPTATPVPSKDTGNSEGTDQSIQTEVTKPAEPSEEVKTDPTKKPDGEKVTKVTPADKGTKKNNDTSSSSSTPKSGDKNEKGQIWVPGFGWVDDSGDNVGNEADDMYENGNKIGEMD
jgi:cytoskeletal protein RodZ